MKDENKPKSDTERQAKRRKKLQDADMRVFYVRGKDGFFDERIRIAKALKEIGKENLLPEQLRELIIEKAVECMPPSNRIERKYITQIISDYLAPDGE